MPHRGASDRKRSRDSSSGSEEAASQSPGHASLRSRQRLSQLEANDEPVRASGRGKSLDSADGATPTRGKESEVTSPCDQRPPSEARPQCEGLRPSSTQAQGREGDGLAALTSPSPSDEDLEMPESVAVGPSLTTSHPLVHFLGSVQLQGFASHLVRRHGLHSLADLVDAAPCASAVDRLLGSRASWRQKAELWKGLLRKQRDDAKRSKQAEAESRLRALAAARETRAQLKRRRRCKVRTPEASPHQQQLRLDECSSAEKPLPVHPRPQVPQPQVTTLLEKQDDQKAEGTAASSSQDVISAPHHSCEEPCPPSQLFERLFQESEALHNQSRAELTKHAGKAQHAGRRPPPRRPPAAFQKENESPSQFMAGFRYEATTAAPLPTTSASPSSPTTSRPPAAVTSSLTAAAVAALRVRGGNPRTHRGITESPGGCVDVDTEVEVSSEGSHEQLPANHGSERSGCFREAGASQVSTTASSRLSSEDEAEGEGIVVDRAIGRGIGHWSTNGLVVSPHISAEPDSVGATGATSSATDAESSLANHNMLTMTTAEACATAEPEASLDPSQSCPASQAYPASTQDNSTAHHVSMDDRLAELCCTLEAHVSAYNAAVEASGPRPIGAAPRLRVVLVPITAADSAAREGDGRLVRVEAVVAAVSSAASAPVAPSTDAFRDAPRDDDDDDDATVLLTTPVLSQLHHERGARSPVDGSRRCSCQRDTGAEDAESSASSVVMTVTCERPSVSGIRLTQQHPRAREPAGARCPPSPRSAGPCPEAPTQVSSSSSGANAAGAEAVSSAEEREVDFLLATSQLSSISAADANRSVLSPDSTKADDAGSTGLSRGPAPPTTRVLASTSDDKRSQCNDGADEESGPVGRYAHHEGGADDAADEDDAWWESLGLGALAASCLTALDPFLSPPQPAADPIDVDSFVENDKSDEDDGADEPTLVPAPPSAFSRSQARHGRVESRRSTSEAQVEEGVGQPADTVAAGVAQIVQRYVQQRTPFEKLPMDTLTSLCDAAGISSDLAIPTVTVAGRPFTESERAQLRREAMAEALRALAVHAVFYHHVAPASLHRVQRMSGLPYRAVKAPELIARGRLLTPTDLDHARRAARAEEQDEVHRCILAALAAEAAERVEAAPSGAMPPPPLTTWERALLLEPVDADAATRTVQADFPHVTYARVHKLLERSGVPLEVVHYSTPSPSPPASQALVAEVPCATENSSFQIERLPSALVPSPQQPQEPATLNETVTEEALVSRSRSHSPLPNLSQPLDRTSPPPEVRRRENARSYFASCGFRTRGGLWRGRGGPGRRGRG